MAETKKTQDQLRKEQMARAEEMRGTWDEAEYRYILNGGTNDVEDALYAESAAWHGKGRVHGGGGIPYEIALMDPALDWEVETRPLYYASSETGGALKVPDAYATVRTTDEAALGVVGSRYQPIQNRQGFEWLKALVDSDDLQIECVLSLRGGKTVAIEARRPEGILIGGEEVVPYLLFTNSHDGSGQAQMLPTDERVVCANTLRFALRGTPNVYKVRHTAGADVKLAEAREALTVSFDYTETLKETGEELLGASFSDNDLSRFLDGLVEVPEPEIEGNPKDGYRVVNQRTIDNRRETQIEIHDLYKSADNLNDVRGTAWGALQAVVEYEQHNRKYNSPDRRIEAILTPGKNRSQDALEILLAR